MDCIQNVTVLVNCLAFLSQTVFILSPPLFFSSCLILVRRLFPHGAKLIFDVIANWDCFQVHTLKLMVSLIIKYRIAFKPLMDFEIKDLGSFFCVCVCVCVERAREVLTWCSLQRMFYNNFTFNTATSPQLPWQPKKKILRYFRGSREVSHCFMLKDFIICRNLSIKKTWTMLITFSHRSKWHLQIIYFVQTIVQTKQLDIINDIEEAYILTTRIFFTFLCL